MRPVVLLMIIFGMMPWLGVAGCDRSPSTPAKPTLKPVPHTAITVSPAPNSRNLLQESWESYRKRFIQGDGRVIDWEGDEKSTSEGQAYAMWRSVFANDPTTFEQTLRWAEQNLRRETPQKQALDSLWAWKWGKQKDGQWTQLDPNFAVDADIDACFALILAAQRWQKPEYLALAKTKLQDIWLHSTTVVKDKRYLLPGPIIAFRQGNLVRLNPSYLAPYAFRLFAEVDKSRDWLALVETSYEILEASTAVSSAGLPSDWIGLDAETGQYQALVKPSPVLSLYGFDASRVWWRVALDGFLYNEPRATQYLQSHLATIESLWRSQKKIPAQLDLQGNPLVKYDATSQYGMLYAAFQLVNPALAQEIYQQKLLPRYRGGFWDNDKAYYTQNLVWFGLLPPQAIAQALQGQFAELSGVP
ncbi:MAG: glycosyl hydrolase [Alkalinema sp. CACIAM 70d]|nr:MAG: glycosyl hydrolase [Alkalinema sp. CACIAM 70d]